MASGFQLIVFPVSDAARGKALFQTLLGVEPYVDQPYYVGFRGGDQEIGLDPNRHGPARPTERSTMPPPPARGPEQRKQDTLRRLEEDVDLWVATADGAPYLIPLSFLWDGTTLLIATVDASPTGRNLRATGRVRLGLGPTRDVVLIDG